MESIRRNFENLTAWMLIVFTALLPVKCGTMILPGSSGILPETFIDWLVMNYPGYVFVLVSAVLLILTAASASVTVWRWKSLVAWWFLWWLGLPVIAGLGAIHAFNVEASVTEIEYCFGLGAWAGAVTLMSQARGERFRMALLYAAAAGMLITTAIGVYQYFWGFEDIRQYIAEQEKLGVVFSGDFKARAWDVRTCATFTFASGLAAALLLMAPVTLQFLWRWGGRFEPVKVSQWLFMGLGAAAMFFVFATTRGRGAFLSAIVAAAVLGALQLKKRRQLLLVLAGTLLFIAIGAWYIQHAGRGFGSMTERVGYLETSVRMLAEAPLCGEGWGNFTYRHGLWKHFGNEELAKDPHNFVAAFAGATGVLGLVWTSVLLLLPLLAGWRLLKRRSGMLDMTLLGGAIAFGLHTLMDLNWQVPGLMGLWIVIANALLFHAETEPEVPGKRKKNRGPGFLCLVFGVAALLSGIHFTLFDHRLELLEDSVGSGYKTPNGRSYSAGEVEQRVQRVLQIAPYSASAYQTWAQDARRRGSVPLEERALLEAWQRDPVNRSIALRLSEFYQAQNDAERAGRFQKEADRLFPYYNVFMERELARKREAL